MINKKLILLSFSLVLMGTNLYSVNVTFHSKIPITISLKNNKNSLGPYLLKKLPINTDNIHNDNIYDLTIPLDSGIYIISYYSSKNFTNNKPIDNKDNQITFTVKNEDLNFCISEEKDKKIKLTNGVCK